MAWNFKTINRIMVFGKSEDIESRKVNTVYIVTDPSLSISGSKGEFNDKIVGYNSCGSYMYINKESDINTIDEITKLFINKNKFKGDIIIDNETIGTVFKNMKMMYDKYNKIISKLDFFNDYPFVITPEYKLSIYVPNTKRIPVLQLDCDNICNNFEDEDYCNGGSIITRRTYTISDEKIG